MNEKNNNLKIAELVGYKEQEIAIIKNTVAKGVNDLELSFFLNVTKTLNLNPFNKEVWCYKDHRGNLITFAGRDGFLKIAQNDKRWNGIISSEVRKGDVFEVDMAKGEIIHKPNFFERGEIIGAYCYIKPKNCDIATIEWAEFSAYKRESPTWKSHPAAMIKKVAEINCLKKAFGISGLQNEHEFTVNEITNTAYPIDTEKKPDLYKFGIIEQLINTCSLDEDSKELIMDDINRDDITNAEIEVHINYLNDNQLNPIVSGNNYGAKEIQKQLDLKMNDPKA